jgi:hypothetical protein
MILAAAALGLSLGAPAHADSLSCDGRIRGGRRLRTYDFGRHRFLQHLTFEQGKLARIEAGTYGAK